MKVLFGDNPSQFAENVRCNWSQPSNPPIAQCTTAWFNSHERHLTRFDSSSGSHPASSPFFTPSDFFLFDMLVPKLERKQILGAIIEITRWITLRIEVCFSELGGPRAKMY
jgi:hypothetical protein